MNTDPKSNAAATEGCATSAGYVWSAWHSVDIDGNTTARNLRCNQCGWQTTYKVGRRRDAMKKHTCPHTAATHTPGHNEKPLK
jgi:hypothetical protein